MKKILLLSFGIIITMVAQQVQCYDYESELKRLLHEIDPTIKKREELKQEILALDAKINNTNSEWNGCVKKINPFIQDLIKDSKTDSRLKIELLQQVFKTTSTGPNDDFLIKQSQENFNRYSYVRMSIFAMVIEHILENDPRNCPIDLIQGFIDIGATPGSESIQDLTSFMDRPFKRDERHGAHYIVKNKLKDETTASEACKKCAQKLDDLFNQLKKKEAEKGK